METYTFLRHFADSWMLLLLVLIFLGVIAWVFRPGARGVHDAIARSIFDHDTKPAGANVARAVRKEPKS